MIPNVWRRPTTWLAISVGLVVLFAVREFISREQVQVPYAEPPPAQALRVPVVFSADPSLGPAAAPVTIVVFSDFQCPYCAQVAPILRSAVNTYSGKLRLVWKDAPSPQHSQALAAAEAAQCAASQGRFWEYHDQLFANQPSLGEQLYTEIAGKLALDLDRFYRCRRQHEPQRLIDSNRDEVAATGVDVTPYLFVNNRRWSGVFTTEEFGQFMQQVTAPTQ